MEDAEALSRKVRNDLNAMKLHVDELRKKQSDSSDVAQIEENTWNLHSRHFFSALCDYNAVVKDNEMRIYQQVSERVKLKFSTDKGCTLTKEEVREFAQAIVSEMETSESPLLTSAKSRLGEEIENRQDYIKMARSMRQLTQLHLDLASILSEQSGLIDTIDHQVKEADHLVTRGHDQVGDTIKISKGNRKCSVWIFVLIAIIFFIVLAVVLGFTA